MQKRSRYAGYLLMVMAVMGCLNPVAFSQSQSQPPQRFIRTPVNGRTVCGLTGAELSFDVDNFPEPIRVWAGIIVDATGGPKLRAVTERHAVWIRERRKHVQPYPPSVTESERMLDQSARLRHCQGIKPKYFDAVLIELAAAPSGGTRFCWAVDFDIDGSFRDENVQYVQEPIRLSSDTESCVVEMVMNAADDGVVPEIRFANTQPATKEMSKATSKAATQNASEKVKSVELPTPICNLQKALHDVDAVKVRKQHLEKVVAAADTLIGAIQESTNPTQFKAALVDAIYRKGRALGYMELPDVIAVKPILDAAAIDQEFEATFQHLNALVDTNKPEYVLLKIRRQRRRNLHGLALDLVDVYRTSHTNPVWHYKKRFDLMTEIEDRLHAHQTAAAMWLFAEKPNRPQLTIFQLSLSQSQPAKPVEGTWLAKPPFRSQSLVFQKVDSMTAESVAWLSDSNWSLTGADILSQNTRRVDFGTGSGLNMLHVQLRQ